jgi:iron(III) transport system ATP-binding protein
MTTADMIVVMNDGRIEQAGTPEDIYERPETEFVARFIGGTNILKGVRRSDDAVACEGGLVVRCSSGSFAASGETAISVRHHDIELSDKRPLQADTNWASGTVKRQIYLGSHRDYLVTMNGGETVRTVAPVNVAIPAGQEVWLHFPQEHCRALAR